MKSKRTSQSLYIRQIHSTFFEDLPNMCESEYITYCVFSYRLSGLLVVSFFLCIYTYNTKGHIHVFVGYIYVVSKLEFYRSYNFDTSQLSKLRAQKYMNFDKKFFIEVNFDKTITSIRHIHRERSKPTNG